MKLVEGAIRRPVTVSMATLAVGLFGLVALPRLSVELLPELSYPTLTIRTDVRDASPGDVEQFVTRPIEEAVGVVSGLERLHSVSRAGQSEVTLEFGSGTRMDGAALAVREKLDLVTLPREARRPALLRFDPALDPIVRLRLSSTDGNLRRLRRIAEQSVQRELEGIGGVAAVRVAGGEEEEIQVDVDAARLSAAGLTLADVSRRLSAANVTLAGGTLTEGRSEYLVRAHNPFVSPEEIATTVLVARPDGAVRLSDVATVRRGARDREVIARVDGKEAVEIAVYKEGDANTVSVARAVRHRADHLGLPAELSLVTVSDQSRFIEASIRDVVDAALWGGLLAILVLFAFLRDLRSTLVIGLSIPISVLATFVVMYRMGLSLNLMSLGGLALSIGNLVDNAIVVLESIHRRRQEGGDPARAAEQGTRDVARAVTASTLTIVAVFLPLVFVEGLAGQLVRDQALTISFSHLASLAVALTLVPTFFVQLSRRGTRTPSVEPAAPSTHRGRMRKLSGGATFALLALPRLATRGLTWLGGPMGRIVNVLLAPFDRGYGWVERTYPDALRRILQRPNRVLASSLGVLVASCLLVLVLPRNLLPSAAHGELRWNVSLPPGTAVAVTDRVLERVADVARHDPAVHLVQTSAGQTDLATFAGGARSAHRGQVAVLMKHAGEARAEARVAATVRRALEDVPGLTYERDEPALVTMAAPIEVEVYAHDLDTLRAATTAVAARLAEVRGLSDVEMSLEPGDPEVQIAFDRERLASMDLDPASAALLIRHAVQGEAATQFDDLERKLDVRVRASESERSAVAELANLEIGRHDGQAVPLGAVADVRVGKGPGEIERIGQQRATRVSAQLAGRDLGSASEDVDLALASLPRAPGVEVRMAGQNRELSGSFGSLQFALLLAVFLVYLVMASQFESLLHPFVILFSLPLAVIGVVWALAATGTSISIMVLIGLVVLVGIVVNNAIVLVDWANQLRRRGLSKVDALVEAGRARLRPILMTMLTTVLGLVPMAIGVGEGAELRAPLAVTLIGGMLLSTVLTLVVIPCVYVTFDRSR